MKKVVIILGSVAEQSHTRALLEYIDSLLSEQGIDTTWWDPRKSPLVFAIPELHKEPEKTPDENVKAFVKLVRGADGFVIGSPLYHGSFSGVLKNALDNLWADAFRDKPVALVGNGSGPTSPNLRPVDHLLIVARTMYGRPLQTTIGTNKSNYSEIDGKLVLVDEDIKQRAKKMVDELIG